MMQKLKYIETDSFARDLKKLLKRFKTLHEDLEVVKTNAIELFHLKNIDNNSVFLLQGYKHESIQFYKVKKFACKALKGRGAKTGLRLIYAYNESLASITLLELYFKAAQVNEGSDRIEAFIQRFGL